MGRGAGAGFGLVFAEFFVSGGFRLSAGLEEPFLDSLPSFFESFLAELFFVVEAFFFLTTFFFFEDSTLPSGLPATLTSLEATGVALSAASSTLVKSLRLLHLVMVAGGSVWDHSLVGVFGSSSSSKTRESDLEAAGASTIFIIGRGISDTGVETSVTGTEVSGVVVTELEVMVEASESCLSNGDFFTVEYASFGV